MRSDLVTAVQALDDDLTMRATKGVAGVQCHQEFRVM
jgi:hypothetical protein